MRDRLGLTDLHAGEVRAISDTANPRERLSVVPDLAEQILQNLLKTPGDLAAEYRRRHDQYVYQSVHPADAERFAAAEWEVVRRGKTRTRLRKEKPHDRRLEDNVWCFFHIMRYPELNSKNFRIQYTRADGTPDTKQLDVFAKDDETVVVIECKSRAERGRRSLSKDLTETGFLQKPIAEAVRRAYGRENKLQIVWVYATRNIVWSEPDLERAAALNIHVLTENELRYYDKFLQHLGPAGRYQVLAEFLNNKKIPGLEGVRIPAVKGHLGKHPFYTFVIPVRHLLKISFVNNQALNHPDGVPAYQRMVTPSRIREIEKFIVNGGFFPTNILINFVTGCKFDPLSTKEHAAEGLQFGWLHLPARYKSAWIIDGQHRLYGYSRLDDKFLNQNLFVLAFDRMATKTEADLFITINQKQKSVPRTILASLKADLLWGSEEPRERIEGLASALVKAMNADPTCPLFQRFAMEGLEDEEGTALTIGEVSKGLVRSGLIGKITDKGKSYRVGALCGSTDEETMRRARTVLDRYFGSIRDANPTRWEKGKPGLVLVNPGIRAHLLLIAELFRYAAPKRGFDPDLCDPEELSSVLHDYISALLEFLKTASDEEMRRYFSRKFGEGGVVEYYRHLCRIIHEMHADFGNEEFKMWLLSQDQARTETANRQVNAIDRAVRDYVFRILKNVHGEYEVPQSGAKAYWEIGVADSKIKTESYARQQDDAPDIRRPVEAYVNTIDLKRIIRQPNNWQHFKDAFDIPQPGEKGKAYYLDWIDRFNLLRRIAAHPSSQRPYTKADFEFLNWLESELGERQVMKAGLYAGAVRSVP